jgi:hypothetical protein
MTDNSLNLSQVIRKRITSEGGRFWAGNGGYELSTLEKYEEFNKARNYEYSEFKHPGYTVRQFLKNIFCGCLEHK